jgi:hypothetical protein
MGLLFAGRVANFGLISGQWRWFACTKKKFSSQYTQQQYSELAALSVLYNSQHTKHQTAIQKNSSSTLYKRACNEEYS